MNFFGTDGIRGTYGSTITDGTAFLLGKSLALKGGDNPIVLIGRDTRLSGESLFNALALGVYSGGGTVVNLGVLPTNSVGHFVRKLGGDYGVMISASHNPPGDNGLKVFDKYGVKLCQSKQAVLSDLMNSLMHIVPNGKVYEPVFYDIDNMYCRDICNTVNVDLSGMRIAIDCCYGASFSVAERVFRMCGAEVVAYCNRNNGKDINVGCGATNTSFLEEKLKNSDIELAFAFDGDCDRLAVLEKGKTLDNNTVFIAIARYMKEEGLLRGDSVVGTVMTNGGVEDQLSQYGIGLVRTAVGDINIYNEMTKLSLNVGGEDSGHYLLSDYATSSDALITALLVCKIWRAKGIIEKYGHYTPHPSVKCNITVTDDNRLLATQSLDTIRNRVASLCNCRIVLRKSGTEDVIRAYAEGQQCEKALEMIKATLCN